eukprot:7792649-Alexandrium_andersonii.AAC.1
MRDLSARDESEQAVCQDLRDHRCRFAPGLPRGPPVQTHGLQPDRHDPALLGPLRAVLLRRAQHARGEAAVGGAVHDCGLELRGRFAVERCRGPL